MVYQRRNISGFEELVHASESLAWLRRRLMPERRPARVIGPSVARAFPVALGDRRRLLPPSLVRPPEAWASYPLRKRAVNLSSTSFGNLSGVHSVDLDTGTRHELMDNQHNSILEARWLLAVPLSLILTVLLAGFVLT